jgi:SAM-dependent methyltransferase
VTEVLAVEPEPRLRQGATDAARTAAIAVHVVDALPAEDGSFDAAVASLVLCTVPDPDAALAEPRRAVRPGGELRFYEHVVSEGSRTARFERTLDAVVWPRLSGGCHLARDTRAAIERAGFQIESSRRFGFAPSRVGPQIAHILGTARAA